MFIVLPNTVDGLSRLEGQLTGSMLNEIDGILQEEELTRLIIPKFEMASDISVVKEALIDLGLSDLFTKRADLSGISSSNPLYVTDIYHKAYIKLDEEGTEAAASTGMNELFKNPFMLQ